MNNFTQPNKTCKTTTYDLNFHAYQCIVKFVMLFELNIIFTGNKHEAKGQSYTIHVFIEDEVEKLNKSILIFIQEDVGNTRVHFFH